MGCAFSKLENSLFGGLSLMDGIVTRDPAGRAALNVDIKLISFSLLSCFRSSAKEVCSL